MSIPLFIYKKEIYTNLNIFLLFSTFIFPLLFLYKIESFLLNLLFIPLGLVFILFFIFSVFKRMQNENIKFNLFLLSLFLLTYLIVFYYTTFNILAAVLAAVFVSVTFDLLYSLKKYNLYKKLITDYIFIIFSFSFLFTSNIVFYTDWGRCAMDTPSCNYGYKAEYRFCFR